MYKGVKTIDDLDFRDKIVFLRVNYDMPLDEQDEITDDSRIRTTIPTIKRLFAKGAKQLILASHMGRPKGVEPKLKMDKVAKKLLSLLNRKIVKLNDCIDIDHDLPTPEEASIVLLENLRFHEEEEKNDEKFAQKLSHLANVYVNDAFAVCHRDNASVSAITKFLPSCIGLLTEHELKVFDEALNNPERPFIVIMGGSKLETKLPMIHNLTNRVDKLLIGGAMMFTFCKAKGIEIGKSLYDKEQIEMARMLSNNDKIVFPFDVVIADDKDRPTHILNVGVDSIPSYMMGLDIGKNTLEKFKQEIDNAKTIIWNGPLGYYENKEFAKATMEIVKYLASKKSKKVIIGGGDTVSIIEDLKMRNDFYHVSTGGGASLTLLEGKELAAIKSMREHTR